MPLWKKNIFDILLFISHSLKEKLIYDSSCSEWSIYLSSCMDQIMLTIFNHLVFNYPIFYVAFIALISLLYDYKFLFLCDVFLPEADRCADPWLTSTCV